MLQIILKEADDAIAPDTQEITVDITNAVLANHAAFSIPSDPNVETLRINLSFAPTSASTEPTRAQWTALIGILRSIPATFTAVRLFRANGQRHDAQGREISDLRDELIAHLLVNLPQSIKEIDCSSWTFNFPTLSNTRRILKERSRTVPDTIFIITKKHIPLPLIYWHHITRELFESFTHKESVSLHDLPEIIDLINEVDQLKTMFGGYLERLLHSEHSTDKFLAAIMLFLVSSDSLTEMDVGFYQAVLYNCRSAAEKTIQLDMQLTSAQKALYKQFIGLFLWHVYGKVQIAISNTAQNSYMKELFAKFLRVFSSDKPKTPSELIAEARVLLEAMRVELISLNFNPNHGAFEMESQWQPDLESLTSVIAARRADLISADTAMQQAPSSSTDPWTRNINMQVAQHRVDANQRAITFLERAVAKRKRGANVWQPEAAPAIDATVASTDTAEPRAKRARPGA